MYMLRLRPYTRNGCFRARPLLSQPSLHRALPLLVTSLVVLALLSLLSCATPQGWCPLRSKRKVPGVLLEPDGPGFYDWDTQSAFDPVRQYGAAVKTPAQLCAAFPIHLLDDIQPVLKTGHALVQARLRTQLRTISACLTNLLIFSDTAETLDGHDIIDVIADLPEHLTRKAKALKAWRNGALAADTATEPEGWGADKFKFMPELTRAWRMRPDMKWYVFFEDDTYLSWDNVFRFLGKLDPDQVMYFGSPTAGNEGTWWANGGPGFILSRGAMRRFLDVDVDPDFGLRRTEEHWAVLNEDCCGDSTLGWALWWNNITIRGVHPMFHSQFANEVTFKEGYWCQPVMSMHSHGQMAEIADLWAWEWENRELDHPLLYRDLAVAYYDFANLTPRMNWNNAERDSFRAPNKANAAGRSAHASADDCQQACEAHANCFQWTYHLRTCRFVRSMHYGRREQPGFTDFDRRQGWFHTWGWNDADLQFKAGWNMAKIRRWIADHPCEKARWVKPSTRRIY